MSTEPYYEIQYDYPGIGWQTMPIGNNCFTDLETIKRTVRRMEEFECAMPGTLYRIIDSKGDVVE